MELITLCLAQADDFMTISLLMDMRSTACARTQSANFIWLFLHMYLIVSDISHLEVAFYRFGSEASILFSLIYK